MNNYRLVKATGGDNTRWWRLYTDNWIEQGGFFTSLGGTVTFLRPMNSTTYTAFAAHNGSSAKGEGVIHCFNKQTTYMNVGLSINASGMAWFSWYVCGYAA